MSDPASKTTGGAVNSVLFGTVDPTVNLEGNPVPAMTTMLYRVCDNDPDKFEEATRIVELFIVEALKHVHA